MRNLFRYVGFRHLQEKPLRTGLTTLGVALGVALYVAIEIINESTLLSFRENVNAVAGKATLTVSAGESGFSEEKAELVAKTPGVQSAVPMIEARAYFEGRDKKSETLMVLGVDLLKEQSVRTYKTADEQVIDDPLVFLNQPDSLIVSHAFAKKHGLQMDSKIKLFTAFGSKQFTIRGLLSPDGPAKAYGGSMAIMDIDGARFTFGKEGKVDRIDVVTKPDATISQVQDRLSQALGAGYTVDRPETQSENMERMVQGFQLMLKFFSTLALLVGIFLVTNSISIAVAERKKEIGVLRALGATRLSIVTLFLTEAIAMGAIGALGGAFLGRGLASIMTDLVSQSMSSQFMTKIDVAHLQFGSREILQAVAIGVLSSLVAALWPASRTTLIQPLEAMKAKEIGEKVQRSWAIRAAPWVGAGLMGFVTISSFQQWELVAPWLGKVNQVTAMLSAALVGPFMVTYLLRLIRPAFNKAGGTVTRLAQDNLLRNPVRTGANIMSLMVGLVLVILVATINMSFRTTIYDWFNRVLTADLLISSNGRVISDQVQPLHESLGQEIVKIPGVLPGLDGSAFAVRHMRLQYNGVRIGMKAFDEPAPEMNYSNLDVIDGDRVSAAKAFYGSSGPAIMVSESFTMHFQKKRGDSIELDTPTGRVTLPIVGVVNDYASPQGVIYIPRKHYRELWKDPLVSVFGVKVAAGHDPLVVRQEIDRTLGRERNLTVLSNTEIKAQMLEVVDQSFTYTRAIEAAALLVGLLGLLNTLFISVMERYRELGMLRAVGMTRGQLSKMILQESLLQGGMGALVAVALGAWITYLWITHSLAHTLGWVVGFHFPWASVLSTLVIGVAVAAFAGFFPARRASRLEIREALDYE